MLFWLVLSGLLGQYYGIFDQCSIERVYLSPDGVDVLEYLPPTPVIYVLNHTAYRDANAVALETLASRDYMMENYGDQMVTVSSSNAYSHDKLRVRLLDYLRSFGGSTNDQDSSDTGESIDTTDPANSNNNLHNRVRPLNEDQLTDLSQSRANESFYLFGDNYGGIWHETAEAYRVANCARCNQAGAKSVGIAGYASGVSFHLHGPGFAQVVHGAKHWFFFPPEVKLEQIPHFGPNTSMYDWVRQLQAHTSGATSTAATAAGADHNSASGAMHQPHDVNTELANTEAAVDVDGLQIATETVTETVTTASSGDSSINSSSSSDGYVDGNDKADTTDSRHNSLSSSNDWDSHILSRMQSCVLLPGELMYFPSEWLHGTLNRENYNHFISTFIDLQLLR